MPDAQNTTDSDNQPLRGGQGFPADNRDGTPSLIGKDDFTKQYEIAKLERGQQQVLTGNIADLNRIGAALAVEGKLPQGVAPAGVDPKDDNVLTPAQSDASRGEWTVESAREGLVPEPIPPTPKPNTEPNSVDPTSVSPRAEAKGSSQSATKSPSK